MLDRWMRVYIHKLLNQFLRPVMQQLATGFPASSSNEQFISRAHIACFRWFTFTYICTWGDTDLSNGCGACERDAAFYLEISFTVRFRASWERYLFNSYSTNNRSNNIGTEIVQEIIIRPPRISFIRFINLQRQSFQLVHKAWSFRHLNSLCLVRSFLLMP